MSINDKFQKIKLFMEGEKGKGIYVILLIVLVAGSSFGLGRLSNKDGSQEPIKIIFPDGNSLSANTYQSAQNSPQKTSPSVANSAPKAYVASQKGKKYYPINCSAASNLKEDNKVFFSTETEAESAGYTKSSSC